MCSFWFVRWKSMELFKWFMYPPGCLVFDGSGKAHEHYRFSIWILCYYKCHISTMAERQLAKYKVWKFICLHFKMNPIRNQTAAYEKHRYVLLITVTQWFNCLDQLKCNRFCFKLMPPLLNNFRVFHGQKHLV